MSTDSEMGSEPTAQGTAASEISSLPAAGVSAETEMAAAELASAETELVAQPIPAAIDPLQAAERRVLGTLIEKAFTTPENYPMTVNALVSGCNQKSNRDPVTDLAADVIDEALLALQKRGIVTRVIAANGRTERWKHNIKDVWLLDRPHRAIIAELLLRGAQTEGELRARASRMVEIENLEKLREVLGELTQRGFGRRLTPEGRKRGVVWAHSLYSADEMARITARLDAEEQQQDAPAVPEAAPSGIQTARSAATAEPLAERVAKLERELDELRSALAKLSAKVMQS